jgi:histidinol-phosphatase
VPDDLQFAFELADLADSITARAYTGEPVAFETKHDGSPVTAIDRAVEEALRDAIARARPGDALLGEEVGPVPQAAGGAPARGRWIVDGIDGTVNFAAGRREWATLIALEIDGEIALGVVSGPTLGRRYWAQRGTGAYWSPVGGGPKARLRVSTTAKLAEATTLLHPWPDRCRPAVRAIADRYWSARAPAALGWHHGLLVAEGAADVALALSGGPWDFAAIVPIVEEAGGTFTDLEGGRRLDTQAAVITNGVLASDVAAVVTGSRD